MAQSFDVCIRGDGMVARCLALLLARDRLRVALHRPQAGPAAHYGAQADVRAYALNRASRELLSALRVWPESPLSTPMTGMQVCGDDGGRLDFEPPEGLGQMAWLECEHGVDKEPVTFCSRHPPGRCVRANDQAQLLKITHDIANGRRGQFQARGFGQGARAHRLTVGNVTLYQRFEQ